MLARVGRSAWGLARETALAHERTLERNLPAVRADLRALGDAYEVRPLPPRRGARGGGAARHALERLDATLGAPPQPPGLNRRARVEVAPFRAGTALPGGEPPKNVRPLRDRGRPSPPSVEPSGYASPPGVEPTG